MFFPPKLKFSTNVGASENCTRSSRFPRRSCQKQSYTERKGESGKMYTSEDSLHSHTCMLQRAARAGTELYREEDVAYGMLFRVEIAFEALMTCDDILMMTFYIYKYKFFS